MSKAARVREQNARAKIEAQRAAARRAQTRRRILITGGSVAVVLALVAGLIAAKLIQSPARATAAPAVADPGVARQITSIPTATFNAVGAGTAAGLKALAGQPELTAGGKPELLYMGGEYCPFCAAERWAIAAAVSRFGTLSGLHFIHSSPTDVYPSTPTLSFYKSRYTSRYLAFVPVEWYGEKADPKTPVRPRLPAAPHPAAGSAVREVRGRLRPVRRHRQPVPGAAGPVPPLGPGQPELGAGGHGDAGSGQPRRQGHRRRGQHDHGRDLQADPGPAAECLRLAGVVAAARSL